MCYVVGYLPDQSSLSNAVCVASCPTASDVGNSFSCFADSSTCISGSFTPQY